MVDDRQRITIIDALQALKPKSEWHLRGDKLKWLDPNQPHPSQADIDNKIVELQAAYDAQAYARSRKAEYPTIQDVTVALAEKTEGDSTMWDEITAKRAAVKAKYPKP